MHFWRISIVVAALSLPQPAAACAQLSENVWMCARDTPWETATWEQFGDGATMLMQDFVLNFSEEFPGKEISDELTTLEEQYTFFAAFQQDNYDDVNVAPTVIRSDRVETDHAAAYRVVQRGIWDSRAYLETAMIAQVGPYRILLQLEAPDEMALATMDDEAESLLSYLRDTCADPVSCADDYEWPPAAPLKEQ